MDSQLIEQYANYLDELERTDPKGYVKLMEEMRSKMPMDETLSMEGLQAAMQTDFTSNKNELRFPGKKVMQAEGLAEQKEGMYVDVSPGFVMKTIELSSKMKLFVNFCSSEHIKIFSKQKKLDENGQEQEGIHVPLSLGPPHEVLDHANKTCLAVDVAVNPQVLVDCDADTSGTFRNFLCELAIQYVEEKYKFRVDPQYKLPKLSYRGELPPPKHYIRKTQAPTIEEVEKTIAFVKPVIPAKQYSLISTLWELNSAQQWIECSRVPACEGGSAISKTTLALAPNQIQCRVSFVHPVEAASIRVQANTEYVLIQAQGFIDQAVYLPYPVDIAQVTADYNVADQVLIVTMTVSRIFHEQQLHADIGSSPWLLSQALNDGNEAPSKPATVTEKFQLKQAEELKQKETSIQEDEVLPEDKFHRKDMMSMYILEQRKADRIEKAKKSEAERLARKEENDAKIAAAKAAGKTWQEMYPNEPETTFVDVDEMLQKEKELKETKEAPVIQETKIAHVIQDNWAEATNLKFSSSLAFELLD
ncbi:hypothetical protein THRCLA_04359 [Thraustotheca clavata]|uniref:PIH1 N-terminal domain-containing protein n=1 Tax=Thraustotheca clavata TaxID=74557 RepID=A0A1V9ZZ92_9STRA|nr:hypothetical protein THRCLA_04359 [Thraustotheca clavata]